MMTDRLVVVVVMMTMAMENHFSPMPFIICS